MTVKRQFVVLVGLVLCVSVSLYVLNGNISGSILYNASTNDKSMGGQVPECPGRSPTPRPYMIPDDDQLDELEIDQLYHIYWTYINTIQVLCRNQTRVGSITDGGKEVCIDGFYKPRQPCIVYSFGSNNQFDFENDVAANFKCEIHTFDPSKGNDTWSIPAHVTFHDTGLGRRDGVNYLGWTFKTMPTIMKELHHEQATIDILKMDIEGWEWIALHDMLGSGSLKNVKQLCIEFHLRMKNAVMVAAQLKILRRLYEYGFLIFMHERNPVIISDNKTPLAELSLININWPKDHDDEILSQILELNI